MRAASEGFHGKAVHAFASQHQAVIHKPSFKVKSISRAFGFFHHLTGKIAVLMPNFFVACQNNLYAVFVKTYALQSLQSMNGKRNAALHIQRARAVSPALFNGKRTLLRRFRVAENSIQMPC